MYNFRYHIVTICSIFLALALGLVLGAGIGGSDIVRDTSNGMVDSLLDEFNTIKAQNDELANQLEVERPLATQLLSGWQNERLKGRTVVVLAGSSSDEAQIVQMVGHLIIQSGGIPTRITVTEPDFGIADEKTAAELQKILPLVEGENYADTLGRALAAEWTYEADPVELAAALQEQKEQTAGGAAGGTAGGATGAAAAASQGASGAAADAGAADAGAAGAADADVSATAIASPAPDAAGTDATQGATEAAETPAALEARSLALIEARFDEQYPLTLLLAQRGIITIETEYITSVAPVGESPREALARLAQQVAGQKNVPYACNGIVNLWVVDRRELSSYHYNASPAGVRIAQTFDELGTAGKLPYPQDSAATETQQPAPVDEQAPAAATTNDEKTPNYYAVLLQASDFVFGLVDVANQEGLSCVTVPNDTAGKYSIIALLSGAPEGIYGTDRSQDEHYPKLPADQTGTAPFTS